MKQESALDTVRKLLTKAHSAGVTPEEAEAFANKAADMILKYNIEQSEIWKKQKTNDRITQFYQGGTSSWKRLLLSELGETCFVFVCYNGSEILVRGRPENIEMLCDFFENLVNQIEEITKLSGITGLKQKNDFRKGLALGVRQKLKQHREYNKDRMMPVIQEYQLAEKEISETANIKTRMIRQKMTKEVYAGMQASEAVRINERVKS